MCFAVTLSDEPVLLPVPDGVTPVMLPKQLPVYWKQDTTFLEPRLIVKLQLVLPAVRRSAATAVRLRFRLKLACGLLASINHVAVAVFVFIERRCSQRCS
jgi:hypothetical protein